MICQKYHTLSGRNNQDLKLFFKACMKSLICLHIYSAFNLNMYLLSMSDYFTVQPMPRGDHVLNFSDAEDLLTDEDLK